MSESDLSDDKSGNDFLLDFEATADCDDGQDVRASLAPLDLIVELSWQAIDRRRDFSRLPRAAAMAVIVRVPTDSWIDPLHAFVRQNDDTILIIDGKSNKRDWRATEALIVDALDQGKTVCGIASDPDAQLPGPAAQRRRSCDDGAGADARTHAPGDQAPYRSLGVGAVRKRYCRPRPNGPCRGVAAVGDTEGLCSAAQDRERRAQCLHKRRPDAAARGSGRLWRGS